MYFFYSLVLSLLFLALLPYFIYQALRHGKYRSSLTQRLGWLPVQPPVDGRPTIWIHAVSVGEFIASRTLILSLRNHLPGHRIVVSTTTMAGQQLARDRSPSGVDSVFYFPFDWTFAVRRVLDHVQPDLVVIMETELWPNFLRQCRKRGIKTVVANGRISLRSFVWYRRVLSFMSQVTGDVSLMIMQSKDDAERARLLGAPADRILVCGNLKYDAGVAERSESIDEEIAHRFGMSADDPLIVAGSTAAGEENMLLRSLSLARKAPGLAGARLLIAPRQPERFNDVADLIVQSGFELRRRSEANQRVASGAPEFHLSATRARRSPDVILLDTIGELSTAYSIADVVFIGGSLVPRGGHNVIEAAVHAKPIIVGPHTENFRQIVADFLQAEALIRLENSNVDSLVHELTRLLSDKFAARAMGERARAILNNGRGATECTVAAIKSLTHG